MFVGIDYSMTSPAICVCPEETFSANHCRFYFLTAQKSKVMACRLPDSEVELHGSLHLPFETTEQRIDQTSSWALQVIYQYRPKTIAIEAYSFASSGARLFQLIENTGVLKYKLHRSGIEIITVPPTTVKKMATGKGNSKKIDMYTAFRNQFPSINLASAFLGARSELPKPVDDLIDSFWICRWFATCHE